MVQMIKRNILNGCAISEPCKIRGAFSNRVHALQELFLLYGLTNERSHRLLVTSDLESSENASQTLPNEFV